MAPKRGVAAPKRRLSGVDTRPVPSYKVPKELITGQSAANPKARLMLKNAGKGRSTNRVK